MHKVRMLGIILTILGWALFFLSLPMPLAEDGPGSLVPNSLPMFFWVILFFTAPKAFPFWIASFCFLISPWVLFACPRGWARAVFHLLYLSMLIVWFPALHQLVSPRPDPPYMRGYYTFAAAYTCVWIATWLNPNPRPRASRAPGFPVGPAHALPNEIAPSETGRENT